MPNPQVEISWAYPPKPVNLFPLQDKTDLGAALYKQYDYQKFSLAASGDYVIGSNENFAIEFLVYTTQEAATGWNTLASARVYGTNEKSWEIGYYSDQLDRRIHFNYWSNGVKYTLLATDYIQEVNNIAAGAVQLNQWSWISVTRYNNYLRLSVQTSAGQNLSGVETFGSGNWSQRYGGITQTVTSRPINYDLGKTLYYVEVGGSPQDGETWLGYIDEFYLRKAGTSAIRQFPSFVSGRTPGNIPYASIQQLALGASINTVALFHFNEDLLDDVSGTVFAFGSLSSSFSQTAQTTSVKQLTSSINVQATETTVNRRLRTNSSDLQVQAFNLTTAKETSRLLADLNSRFTQTATVDRQRISGANLTASVSLNYDNVANIVGIQPANFSATFDTSSQAQRTRTTQSQLNAQFSTQVSDRKTVSARASLTSQASLYAKPVTGDNLTSVFNLNTTATVVRGARSSLQAQFRMRYLNPEFFAEAVYYTIKPELRLYTIEAENRNYKIRPDLRVYKVKG